MNVAPGICPTCGHRKTTWSPALIVAVCLAWARKHGAPPRAKDWANGTPDHPANSTVLTIFGSWNAMLEAAGFDPRASGAPRGWSREEVVGAMQAWRADNGRWPTFRDWTYAAPGHPCASTATRLFGSWNAARRAAGYNGAPKARRKLWDTKRIPAAPVAEVVRTSGYGIAPLAERVGMRDSDLHKALFGQKTITFRLADTLLSIIDRPDAWHGELAGIA